MKRPIDGIARRGVGSGRGKSGSVLSVSDQGKRLFIRSLGVVGLGAFLLSMFPKKAQGLVFGNTMRADPVGLKNAAGTQINPATKENQESLLAVDFATETTLSAIKSGTDNLDVALSDIMAGTERIPIDPATESTIDKRFNSKTTVATSISTVGDNTILTPTPGSAIRLYWVGMSVDSANPSDVLATVKIGGTTRYRWHLGAFSHWQTIDGAVDAPLVVTLSSSTVVQFNYTYEEI